MADELLHTLEDLEHRGWNALCDGTAAEFYGDLMTDDGQMVLANGVAMTRDQVVAALREAPTWDGYELRDLRLVTTGRQSAAMVYTGTARRDGQPDFTAVMSSVYMVVDGRWRLALYTQTPVPA